MKISQLTDYDKEVHRAIQSLYFTGNEFITESMVLSAMNWFRDPLSQWKDYFNELEKVRRSIEKQRQEISPDGRYFHNNKRVLEVQKLSAKIGWNKYTAYKFLSEPIYLDD